jgi:hypothetical protein
MKDIFAINKFHTSNLNPLTKSTQYYIRQETPPTLLKTQPKITYPGLNLVASSQSRIRKVLFPAKSKSQNLCAAPKIAAKKVIYFASFPLQDGYCGENLRCDAQNGQREEDHGY